MPTLAQIWFEITATATVVLFIPAYMGFIHVAPLGAAAYALVGGFAMAVGEQLQFRLKALDLTPIDVLLWSAAIAGTGGVAYVLALIFI